MQDGISDIVHSPDVRAGGQESLIVPDAFNGEQISAHLYSGTIVCAYGPATITVFATSVIGSMNPYQTWTKPPYHLEAGQGFTDGEGWTSNPC